MLNETYCITHYLKLMASIDRIMDTTKTLKLVEYSFATIYNLADEKEADKKIIQLKETIDNCAKDYIRRFPPKMPIKAIGSIFRDLILDAKFNQPFIEFGLLDKLMDLKELKYAADLPDNYRIGIYHHKGYGGIEELFLLREGFDALVKSHFYWDISKKFYTQKAVDGKFDKEFNDQVNLIYSEVCSNCRQVVIIFFAFIESFVNSIGYTYLQKNKLTLTKEESEILMGFKKSRYIQLKTKLELFQKVIRSDKKVVIVTTDEKQIQEPFLSFFTKYSELRNSSMHYSPLKEPIWLSSSEWIEIANQFSKLAIEVALQFWKCCFGNSTAPVYLSCLNYQLLYLDAEIKHTSLQLIYENNCKPIRLQKTPKPLQNLKEKIKRLFNSFTATSPNIQS